MRIKELDALRGLAAIGVFFFHFQLFDYGYLGVHLFFIISGFVIFLTANKVKGSGDFAIARVSRLYPTYWVCVTLTTLVLLLNAHDITLKQFVLNLTMFQMFLGAENIDGAYWSLTEELVFYGVMFVVIAINGLKKVNYWLSFMILAAVGGLFLNPEAGGLQKNVQDVVKYFSLFAAGILFYLLYTEEKLSYAKVGILVLCLLITLQYNFGKHLAYYNHTYEMAIIVGCFAIFTLLIAGKLAFLNRYKWLLFMGEISYPFYLLHQEIGLSITRYFQTDNIWLYLSIVLGVFAIITVMAYLITAYFERVASKALKQRLVYVSDGVSGFISSRAKPSVVEQVKHETEAAVLEEPVTTTPDEQPKLEQVK